MKSSAPLTPNVLLVDESRDGLLVRRAVLEELGCHVEVAPSSEEGLKLYGKANFDVVVTGHRLPGLDGIGFIAQIRKLNPSARIVLVCGLMEPLGLTEENTGADVVIAKSAKEPIQLGRWVKRLTARGPARKPPAKQGPATVQNRAIVR